jgi:hypothetical protein
MMNEEVDEVWERNRMEVGRWTLALGDRQQGFGVTAPQFNACHHTNTPF